MTGPSPAGSPGVDAILSVIIKDICGGGVKQSRLVEVRAIFVDVCRRISCFIFYKQVQQFMHH